MIDALCAEHPEVSFAMPTGDPRTAAHARLIAAAKAICADCPVIGACRESAVGPRGGDRFPGLIVAGKTPAERSPARPRAPRVKRDCVDRHHPLVLAVMAEDDRAYDLITYRQEGDAR